MYHIARLVMLHDVYGGNFAVLYASLKTVTVTRFPSQQLVPVTSWCLDPMSGTQPRCRRKTNRRNKTTSKFICLNPSCMFLVDQEFLCAINGHMMKHPARSPHGHVFEYSTILLWLESRGRVCPFTGKPLSKGKFLRITAVELQTLHGWKSH